MSESFESFKNLVGGYLHVLNTKQSDYYSSELDACDSYVEVQMLLTKAYLTGSCNVAASKIYKVFSNDCRAFMQVEATEMLNDSVDDFKLSMDEFMSSTDDYQNQPNDSNTKNANDNVDYSDMPELVDCDNNFHDVLFNHGFKQVEDENPGWVKFNRDVPSFKINVDELKSRIGEMERDYFNRLTTENNHVGLKDYRITLTPQQKAVENLRNQGLTSQADEIAYLLRLVDELTLS